MPSRISLRNFDEFQKRCQDLADVGTEIRKELGTHVPRQAPAIWNPQESMRFAKSRLDRAALGGARVRASDKSVSMFGATSPKVKGIWREVEFGDGKKDFKTYTRRSPKGKVHQVTRRTQNQLPDRNRKGRVLYKAGAESMNRFARLIGQTVVRTIHEVLEGRK